MKRNELGKIGPLSIKAVPMTRDGFYTEESYFLSFSEQNPHDFSPNNISKIEVPFYHGGRPHFGHLQEDTTPFFLSFCSKSIAFRKSVAAF
jgi:hypothetical protein